jgi:hypothetical protein
MPQEPSAITLDEVRDGQLIALADVPALYQRLTGRRISHQAVWAWTKHGVNVCGGREYLRAFKRGRRCFVTGKALRTFLLQG